MNIVWFKRDLRLSDHQPLVNAIEAGQPIVLLYIFEPSLLEDPHYQARHWQFVWQSLKDMRRQLKVFDLQLHVTMGEAQDVFDRIHREMAIDTVYSHEETGIDLTYQRDLRLADYLEQQDISWEESQTNAVFRGLMHRDGYRKKWRKVMRAPLAEPNWEALIPAALPDNLNPMWQEEEIPWRDDNDVHIQDGGEAIARNTLRDFIHNRARNYSNHISKPEESRFSCSRLSPYFTWGNLSIRQAYQYLRENYDDLSYKRHLKSFESRLRWHCHFIQKFESEPRIEFENMNRGYDDIRTDVNETYVTAWKEGRTGFPLVDACMRCVNKTGYLNFRMRAMLVSVLTHHLWQGWRQGAVHLARQFTDFEPGIHYSQFQMQACTTGVTSVRIYNPVKQSLDHDPEGIFIKQWVPELRKIPAELIHKPWEMSNMEQEMYDCVIDRDYPNRLVDHKAAYKEANSKLWSKKGDARVKEENERILRVHVKNRS
jgi:deoxyribodipyrimidine photo-lyase